MMVNFIITFLYFWLGFGLISYIMGLIYWSDYQRYVKYIASLTKRRSVIAVHLVLLPITILFGLLSFYSRFHNFLKTGSPFAKMSFENNGKSEQTHESKYYNEYQNFCLKKIEWENDIICLNEDIDFEWKLDEDHNFLFHIKFDCGMTVAFFCNPETIKYIDDPDEKFEKVINELFHFCFKENIEQDKFSLFYWAVYGNYKEKIKKD